MQPIPRPLISTFCVCVLALLFAVIASAGPALAAPASSTGEKLGAAHTELESAQGELRTLQQELDKLALEHARSQERVEEAEARTTEAQENLAAARDDFTRLQARLEERLAGMYKARGSHIAAVLEILVAEERSLTGVLDRIEGLRRVVRQDGDLFAEVRTEVAELERLEADLSDKETAAQRELESLSSSKQRALTVLEGSRDEYNALREKVRRLEEQKKREDEERRRLEEQERRKREEAARQAEQARKEREQQAPRQQQARAQAAASSKSAASTPAAPPATSPPATSSRGSSRSESPPAVSTSKSGWVFPVQGPNSFINDWGFARSGGRKHQGTDIMTPRNTPVVAVFNGVISKASPVDKGLGGVTLWLRGEDGNSYYYAHLESIAKGISVGTRVKGGQIIGYAGDSGNARGGETHLHFEIHRGGGGAVNPYPTLVKYR